MSKKNETSKPTRELPISLQGIETILQYLNKEGKLFSSIRGISEHTGLSMRVVKNILLQLEKFNQVERVIEKNNILPKWKITKFGKRVIKEAKGIENNIKFPSREDELIYNVNIPTKIEQLRDEGKIKQESIISELNSLQIDLSKTLGPIVNANNPIFEDLIGLMIKRVKFLRQRVANFPQDPVAGFVLKKMDEKKKKISKEEEKLLLVEIYFFYSIILNELKRIAEFVDKLTQFVENEAISNGYSVAKNLRDEIRILNNLLNQRESLTVNNHKISEEELKQISKGNITPRILQHLIGPSISEEAWIGAIEEFVLKIIESINKGTLKLEDHNYDIKENIPIISLYNLILDEKPSLNFTIEQLEQIINSLADRGYIPGINIIQEDENHYLKVVQLKTHDISEDESKLISYSLKVEKFSLVDIVDKFNWSTEKALQLLDNLTSLGILKHSKSYLYGDQWYVVSEFNN